MWEDNSISARKERLPSDWELVRRRILDRDHYTCTTCGGHATHVDHIESNSTGSVPDELLQALCASCHATKSAREGGHARAAAMRKARRPDTTHPGLRW